jgi:CheY-like chemotaxis protein
MARNKVNSGTGLKVLYIEDDPVQRAQLADELRRRGHTIVDKKSGEDGLKTLESEKVEIVLCDLNMDGG